MPQWWTSSIELSADQLTGQNKGQRIERSAAAASYGADRILIHDPNLRYLQNRTGAVVEIWPHELTSEMTALSGEGEKPRGWTTLEDGAVGSLSGAMMKVQEVIMQAMAKSISWRAAEILGVSPRFQLFGDDAVQQVSEGCRGV